MLIDFSTQMKTLSGDLIPKTATEGLKLSHVCCDALFATYDDEKNLSGDDKAKRFVLATKVHDQGVVDLAPEDIVLLKKLVGRAFSPLIVGQCYAALDPKKPELLNKSA